MTLLGADALGPQAAEAMKARVDMTALAERIIPEVGKRYLLWSGAVFKIVHQDGGNFLGVKVEHATPIDGMPLATWFGPNDWSKIRREHKEPRVFWISEIPQGMGVRAKYIVNENKPGLGINIIKVREVFDDVP